MEDKKEDKKYAEIAATYRFFLGWRHAEFVGILVFMYAVISLTFKASEINSNLFGLIPIFALPVVILIWIVDIRTRDLYHAAINAGMELEGNKGGLFTHLDKVRIPKGKSAFSKRSHSMAINFVCTWSIIILIILSGYSFFIKN